MSETRGDYLPHPNAEHQDRPMTLRIHSDDWPDTLSRIYRHGPRRRIAELAWPLWRVMRESQIDTALRAAHFIAQIGHESAELRYLEELWGPSQAQRRYEGRRDLGNTQPGDGYRFRGRGPMMITGRANYRALGQALGIDLESDPDRINTDSYVTMASAGWYWSQARINPLADTDDLSGITRAINGGYNGLADRRRLYGLAREAIEWAQVRQLQRTLNDVSGAALAVDGAYGALTKSAVADYQQMHPTLVRDGIAGPLTWAALVADLEQFMSDEATATLGKISGSLPS